MSMYSPVHGENLSYSKYVFYELWAQDVVENIKPAMFFIHMEEYKESTVP